MSKKKNIDKDEIQEKSFIAYIIKGNRQVIKRDVIASKRFRVDDDTYIVMDDCIFYKNIEGILQSVSYYREGNPRPYSFKETNQGLTEKELNKFYEKDFSSIIAKIKPFSRVIYIFLMSIVNLVLCLLFMVMMLILEYII